MKSRKWSAKNIVMKMLWEIEIGIYRPLEINSRTLTLII